MSRLGIEPGAVGWLEQTDPLSFLDFFLLKLSYKRPP